MRLRLILLILAALVVLAGCASQQVPTELLECALLCDKTVIYMDSYGNVNGITETWNEMLCTWGQTNGQVIACLPVHGWGTVEARNAVKRFRLDYNAPLDALCTCVDGTVHDWSEVDDTGYWMVPAPPDTGRGSIKGMYR